MSFQRRGMTAAVVVAAAFMTGCAVQAPVYQPSIQNVEALKRGGRTQVAVGAFTVQAGMAGAASLSLRATPMSPIQGTYADYLATALKMEIEMANRHDPKSTIEVSGVLTKNVMSVGGISRNDGEIEARVVVRRDGQVRYDKTQRGTAEWESSFAGAIAIPKAQQQYPMVVQSLLATLYADVDFQSAIR